MTLRGGRFSRMSRLIPIASLISLVSLTSLTGCGGSESNKAEQQPEGDADAKEQASGCVGAIAELATFVEGGGSTDSLPARLEGLCEQGPADLLGTYARLERGERRAEPDEDTKKWVLEACPEFEEVKKTRGDTEYAKRNDVFWTTCDLKRYGVTDSLDDLGINGTPLAWAIHAWMLSTGASEADAKTVTRGLLALDRQWSGPFSYSSAAPTPALPIVEVAPAAVYSGRELLIVRSDSLDYGPNKVAELDDGSFDARELQAPSLEAAEWDVLIHRGLLGALRGRCRAGAWVAADPEVPFATLARVISTAQPSCESIELLVETGEPGAWRVGTLEVELATLPPKTLPADVDVDAWMGPDGVHVLTAREDIPCGTALSAIADWCTGGVCPTIHLALPA